MLSCAGTVSPARQEAARQPCRDLASQIPQREQSAYQQDGKNAHHQRQAAFQKILNRRAKFPQKSGDQKKPHAPRHQTGHNKRQQGEVCYAAGNGDKFVRDRGQPLEQDNPHAPLAEFVLQGRQRMFCMVKMPDVPAEKRR